MTMQQFRAPRGTADILPSEQAFRNLIITKVQETISHFGYERIDTPMFEDARLFVRATGETTDIVEKETYTFEDRGGDLLSLRPEGTPPVCRAYLEHGMHNMPQPVRLYYIGPFFRYERPQSGRYRQFTQLGVEVLGDGDAIIDAEIIELAMSILGGVGLTDVTLKINSIGDRQCRPGYVEKLKEYYRPRRSEVCDDCQRRMERNPLRLLDCKKPSCQQMAQAAPKSVDYLCRECASHFDNLKKYLGLLELPFAIDHCLVRGLDYYTKTVFEIQPEEEGGQSKGRTFE